MKRDKEMLSDPEASIQNDKIYIYLPGFAKRYLKKFLVRFNNLNLEVNKKQLKVAI